MLPTCRNHADVSEGVRHCSRCGSTFCADCLVEIGGLPHCAACKHEQLLDIRSGVDRHSLNYAGIGKRFLGMFIDNLLVFVPLYVLFLVAVITATANRPGQPPAWIAFIYLPLFLVPFLYEAIMLQAKNGQTVGKIATNMRVVRPDGSPISAGQAWGRAGLRTVLGCLWIVDYVPAFFTRERATLHDLAAGTRVVDLT